MPKVSTQSPHLKSLTTSRKPMKSPHTPKAFAVYLHTEKPCKSICNLRAFEVAPMPKGFAISLLPMSRECRTIPEKVKHSPRYDRAKSFSISVRAFGVPLYKTDLWSFCSTYEPMKSPHIPKVFAISLQPITLAPSRNAESVLLAKRLCNLPACALPFALTKKPLTSKARWAVVGYCVRIIGAQRRLHARNVGGLNNLVLAQEEQKDYSSNYQNSQYDDNCNDSAVHRLCYSDCIVRDIGVAIGDVLGCHVVLLYLLRNYTIIFLFRCPHSRLMCGNFYAWCVRLD